MKFKLMIPFIEEAQKSIKLHCAIGEEDEYDELNGFMNGDFKRNQELQSKKNFNRDYILSFVYYQKNEWLFVGIYQSLGVEPNPEGKGYIYNTKLTDIGKEFIGKAVIYFEKDFRQSYLCLENYLDKLELIELKKDIVKPKFPGYNEVNVSWKALSKWIYTDSWRTALENQKAVYLITDTHTGKRYVGSACGNDMLWGRWEDYIKNGHGGNTEFKELSFDYIKENFRYSILDIFKSTTDDSIIYNRESWWKEVLMTRNKKYGYNIN